MLLLIILSKRHPNPLASYWPSGLLLDSFWWASKKLRACSPPTKLPPYLQLDSEPCYQGEFKAGSDPAVKEKLDAWLLHLPQVLWELGDSNLPATEVSISSTSFLQTFIILGVDGSPGGSPGTATPVETLIPNWRACALSPFPDRLFRSSPLMMPIHSWSHRCSRGLSHISISTTQTGVSCLDLSANFPRHDCAFLR